MKKLLWIPVAAATLGITALVGSQAFADQGSGQSAGTRADEFVVICHYDRNQQGPNAGPHTITVHVTSLDQHLVNHVKAEGFVGDDHVGACPESTPAQTGTVPVTRTAVPTQLPD